MVYVISIDSDKPVHLHSLVRVYTYCMDSNNLLPNDVHISSGWSGLTIVTCLQVDFNLEGLICDTIVECQTYFSGLSQECLGNRLILGNLFFFFFLQNCSL